MKDSFASLDLAGYGFGVLFGAEWISRPADLARWTEAWQGPAGLLRACLLADDSVAVLAAGRDGELTAGAILNTSATVTGVTNVFSTSGVDPWPDSCPWPDPCSRPSRSIAVINRHHGSPAMRTPPPRRCTPSPDTRIIRPEHFFITTYVSRSTSHRACLR